MPYTYWHQICYFWNNTFFQTEYIHFISSKALRLISPSFPIFIFWKASYQIKILHSSIRRILSSQFWKVLAIWTPIVNFGSGLCFNDSTVFITWFIFSFKRLFGQIWRDLDCVYTLNIFALHGFITMKDTVIFVGTVRLFHLCQDSAKILFFYLWYTPDIFLLQNTSISFC